MALPIWVLASRNVPFFLVERSRPPSSENEQRVNCVIHVIHLYQSYTLVKVSFCLPNKQKPYASLDCGEKFLFPQALFHYSHRNNIVPLGVWRWSLRYPLLAISFSVGWGTMNFFGSSVLRLIVFLKFLQVSSPLMMARNSIFPHSCTYLPAGLCHRWSLSK